MPVRAGTLWDGVHLDVPVGNAVAVWRLISVESGIPGCPPPAGLCSGAAGSPGGEGGPGLSAAAAAALFTAPRGPLARFAERLLGPFLAPLLPQKKPLTFWPPTGTPP